MRAFAIGLILVLLAPGTPIAGALWSLDPEEPLGCPSGPPNDAWWLPGTVRIGLERGEAVAVRFRVHSTATLEFWSSWGYHFTTQGASERASALHALRDDAGLLSVSGGTTQWPVGPEVVLVGIEVVAPGAPGACTSNEGTTQATLAPGDYTFIMGFVSQQPNEAAVYLPEEVTILGTTRSVAQEISETTLECADKRRIAAAGVAHEEMSGCRGAFGIGTRAHWAWTTGASWDSNHVVYWDTPDAPERRAIYEDGAGGPGVYEIRVERYTSTLAVGLSPQPGQGSPVGIYGLIADI